MKRFDKGYIYSALLTDFFYSIVAVFVFLEDFFLNEESNPEDIAAAIPFFVIGFIVIYLCLFIYRILYYRASGYELTEGEIKCKRGVFFRKRSLLEYKKVHAINKKQNIIQRIFGIAVLTVDSGSANTSHQAEITIIEKARVVDALISEINSLKEGGVRSTEEKQEREEVLLSDTDSLYRFTSKKKMLYSLINIVSTAFFVALFGVLAIVGLGACKLALSLDFLGTWGEFFLFAVLIMLSAMLLTSALSFIGSMVNSFVKYHGFTVTKREGNIEISYGLFEKHTNTFSEDRIKAVKISQGLVQRMLGFATVKLEVIGYTVNSGEDSKNAELGVLVPFCRYEEIGEILGRILPGYTPDEKKTRAVSYFPFVSWFLLIFGGIAAAALLLTALVMLLLNAPGVAILATLISIFGAGVIVLAVKAVSAALGYQINGVALNEGKITVYSGGFTKNVTVFKTKNLIAVENVTTPLRKRAGIASLVMHLKTNSVSNEVKVHIQKDALSEELEGLLLV